MRARTRIFLNNEPVSTDASDVEVYPSGRVYVKTQWTRERYLYICHMLAEHPRHHYLSRIEIDDQSFRIELSVAQKVERENRIDLVNENVEAHIRRCISRASLASIRQRPIKDGYSQAEQWDVFISYASEDRETVARPLAKALADSGLTVWFDDAVLRVGDGVRRKIDEGLARSRFGVVILSVAFFSKGWPQYELDGMITKSVSGEQNVLPILHELTREQMRGHSPSLADIVSRSTSEWSVVEIAQEMIEVIEHRRERG